MLERIQYWCSKWVRQWAGWLGPRPAQSLGARGELLAQAFLRKRRYRILETGFTDHQGEIDIVAVDRRTVVFVEVKTRMNDQAGHPVTAVDDLKQKKIIRTAQTYVQNHQLHDCRLRYDIVSILYDEREAPLIEHFVDAFREDDVSL